MKILVVDDDLAIRTVVRHMLTASGFEVVEAENGEKAFEILNNSDFETILYGRPTRSNLVVRFTHKGRIRLLAYDPATQS